MWYKSADQNMPQEIGIVANQRKTKQRKGFSESKQKNVKSAKSTMREILSTKDCDSESILVRIAKGKTAKSKIVKSLFLIK